MARKHSLPPKHTITQTFSEGLDPDRIALEMVKELSKPPIEVPQAIPVKKSWRVLKEQMVIIQGGTTYVAVGKIVRDPQIAQKLLDQGVEMESIEE